MLNTRDAAVLRMENLPGNEGYVSILQMRDGRVLVKRYAARSRVFNVVDRYEHSGKDGRLVTVPLDVEAAGKVVDALLAGKPWSDCFLIGTARSVEALPWVKSEEEHRYTSTGVKFWRHREAMESYRAGTGRTVVSTHISPEGSCNLRCGYCSVTYRDTHSRIPLDRIKKYVVDLQSRGLKAVILTGGGEPTLYPQFNELVDWLKWERRLSVALITNGTTGSHVKRSTWAAFSWVRVSINIFDGWQEKIWLPEYHVPNHCVVGASFVYSVEHEAANEQVPMSRVELFRQVGEVATKLRAQYVRVLPNCLLEQGQLIREHHALQADLAQLNDPRFFQQYKVHRAPESKICHQAFFRPYLSEEPWTDGVPGTVYPCDSVVLNDSTARFANKWALCKPEQVLDFMDGKIVPKFEPYTDCSGCVFTESVEMLGAFKDTGYGDFSDEALVHEEFV